MIFDCSIKKPFLIYFGEMDMNDYKLEMVSSNIAPWEPKNEPSRQIVVMMSGGVDSSYKV